VKRRPPAMPYIEQTQQYDGRGPTHVCVWPPPPCLSGVGVRCAGWPDLSIPLYSSSFYRSWTLDEQAPGRRCLLCGGGGDGGTAGCRHVRRPSHIAQSVRSLARPPARPMFHDTCYYCGHLLRGTLVFACYMPAGPAVAQHRTATSLFIFPILCLSFEPRQSRQSLTYTTEKRVLRLVCLITGK